MDLKTRRTTGKAKAPTTSRARAGWAGVRVVVTAGPTHEPIDAVRFIGNRSSGQMGLAIAAAAAQAGARVTLLLGPGVREDALGEDRGGITIQRFMTAADLGKLLQREQPRAGVIIMAAAVADFTPVVPKQQLKGKLTREAASSAFGKGAGRPRGGLLLEFVPTEDLIAACVRRRDAARASLGGAGRGARASSRHSWAIEQRLVGFALEPRRGLIEAARAKLERKGLDAIVANPLETMESATIEGTLVLRGRDTGGTHAARSPGRMSKSAFARWLIESLGEA
jgi:phosphopantothenoylcysteine decarboxylase / phosphopantothenate---cysteine ligase